MYVAAVYCRPTGRHNWSLVGTVDGNPTEYPDPALEALQEKARQRLYHDDRYDGAVDGRIAYLYCSSETARALDGQHNLPRR